VNAALLSFRARPTPKKNARKNQGQDLQDPQDEEIFDATLVPSILFILFILSIHFLGQDSNHFY
jgi:hypothetical protein